MEQISAFVPKQKKTPRGLWRALLGLEFLLFKWAHWKNKIFLSCLIGYSEVCMLRLAKETLTEAVKEIFIVLLNFTIY